MYILGENEESMNLHVNYIKNKKKATLIHFFDAIQRKFKIAQP